MLPGSRAILFTVTHTPLPKWDDTEVVVQELANGARRARLESAADGRYVASGHIVYVQRGTIMAAPFDLASLKVTGGAIGVVAGVMQSANTTNEAFDSGAGQFAVSSGGSLLYLPGGIFPDAERTLVWVGRTGAEEPLPLPVRAYLSPRLSPDGKLITVWTQGDRNVWIYDLAAVAHARQCRRPECAEHLGARQQAPRLLVNGRRRRRKRISRLSGRQQYSGSARDLRLSESRGVLDVGRPHDRRGREKRQQLRHPARRRCRNSPQNASTAR
jgi:hypothetical protein